MFACVGAIQALVGLVSPVYQLIYRATYDWHRGFVYCMSCTILSLMLALTIYVFFFLKRYEKKLKAARILSEDKADTSEKTEKPTVLFRPSFKKIDPVDVYWITYKCLNYVYVQSSYQNTFSYSKVIIQSVLSY